MITTRPSRRSDRGVSAVIVALLLSAVMTVGAFAVDIGAAYTERRHDQNTVDSAVMSGMVRGALQGGVVNDIVAEVRSKVNTTLGRTVSADAWDKCTDSAKLHFSTRQLAAANPTISPVTDCISFSRTFDELRVKLPDQSVETVFAPALGIDRLKTSASAHAKLVNAGIGGPPFIALSTATQGDFVCLRTSSPGEPLPLMDGRGPKNAPLPGTRPDPCDSASFAASTSSFGTLLPWRYRSGPNHAACTRAGNQSVTDAIAIGVDHIMGAFVGGYSPSLPVSATRLDGGSNCQVAFPNTFEVDTGFAAGELRCALISRSNSNDCNGLVPRFHQGDNFPPTNPAISQATSQRFIGEHMDNIPPWHYLRPAQALYDEGAPPNCVAVAASRTSDTFDLRTKTSEAGYSQYNDVVDSDWDHYDRYDAFTACIKNWGAKKQPVTSACSPDPAPDACYWPRNIIFTRDLGRSPRFGFVPQVWESQITSQTHFVHIEGFLPIFMYRMYTKSLDTPAVMCDPADLRPTTFAVHDAGQVFPTKNYQCGKVNGQSTVDRLASMILACGMVTRDLCDKQTGYPKASGLDIYDFRLTK